MLTDEQARALALRWRDPLEHPDDPDPLAEFGRRGVMAPDLVLDSLGEIELALVHADPAGDSLSTARERTELEAMLEYVAERSPAAEPCAVCDTLLVGAAPGERCPHCLDVVPEPVDYSVAYWS